MSIKNELKPIILVGGVPHSFTSVVSNFLLDHGAKTLDLTKNDNSEKTNYLKYESEELIHFTKEKMKFKDVDLTEYFLNLPNNEVILLKYPLAVWFAEDLQRFTHRPLKLVFVMRNPNDVILSNMKKSKTSFIYNFERISWLYSKMAQCELPTFTLISERLLIKDENLAKSLLDFCDLSYEKVQFSAIDSGKISVREPKFVKYRFWNFLWKRLSFFFTVYK